MKRKKTSDNDTDKTVEQPDAIDSNCASIKNAATVVREFISMCVAPVRLRHCNSQKEVKTFVLLDSCSQDTFVTEQILQKLDVTGVNQVPVDPSEVATPVKLKKWHYVDCVADKIASDDAVSIDVLIDAN